MSDASAGRLARLEAALQEGLSLLEKGRDDEAREVLRRAAAPGISQRELDDAFESATPETEHMRHADDVAQAVLRDESLLGPDEDDDDAGTAPTPLPESFATATMAGLLEEQGDHEGARRIRSRLAPAEKAPASRPSRREVVATLERWLSNVRRTRA